MILKLNILFCENEHGFGDVTFPDLAELSDRQTVQEFIRGNTVQSVRKEAKTKGWGRVGGADYCPACMEDL